MAGGGKVQRFDRGCGGTKTQILMEGRFPSGVNGSKKRKRWQVRPRFQFMSGG